MNVTNKIKQLEELLFNLNIEKSNNHSNNTIKLSLINKIAFYELNYRRTEFDPHNKTTAYLDFKLRYDASNLSNHFETVSEKGFIIDKINYSLDYHKLEKEITSCYSIKFFKKGSKIKLTRPKTDNTNVYNENHRLSNLEEKNLLEISLAKIEEINEKLRNYNKHDNTTYEIPNYFNLISYVKNQINNYKGIFRIVKH